MKYRTIAILTLTLLTSLQTVAKVNFQNIRFEQYTVSNGLPHNTIYALEQDNDGFIWVGTPNGLCRFDGYEFRTYYNDPADSTSLPHNLISHIHNDKNRNILWIQTDKGFCSYNPQTEKFKSYKVCGTERKNAYFYNTSSGDLLLGSMDGIFRYDEKTDSFVEFLRIPGKITRRIAEDSNGILWFKSGYDLVRYDLHEKRYLPIPVPLEKIHTKISNIYITDDNRLIFCKGSDFYVYDINTETIRTLEKEIDTKGYRCVETDSEGNIWLGTEYGIFIYDKEYRLLAHYDQTSTDLSQLNDSPVYCIFKDNSKNIWIGTYFGGINFFSFGTDMFHTWPVGNSRKHLSGKAVRQIINDGKNGLYVSTEDGGLNHIDNHNNITRASELHRQIGIQNIKNVHSLHMDKNNNLWIGLYLEDIVKYTPESKEKVDYSTLNPQNASAFFIEESKNGSIFYGGPEGIFHIPFGKKTVEKLYSERVICSSKQNDSILWIGSRNKGLYSFNMETTEFKHLNLLSETNPFITYIYKDPAGLTWIGTNNNGIFATRNGETLEFTLQKDKLGSNAIKGIISDNEGNIWIGTDNGLCKIHPETLSVIRFTDSDGLPIKQFNYASACRKDNGELYFGTINGMVSFFPKNLNISKQEFKVKLTNIYSNSDKLPLASIQQNKQEAKKIHLSHKQARSLRFEYSGLNFRYGKKTVYAMKLEGIDKEWQYVGNQHQVRFSNLPTGSYILKIKAGYDGSHWDETGQLTIPIHVSAPWWSSAWALIIYAGIICGITLMLFRYAKSRLLLSVKLKEEQQKRLNIEKLNKQKLNFFTYISHDLKTPLTLILAPLQQLIEQKNITNDDRKQLEVVYRNASRMNYLIDELLTFSKIEMNQTQISVRKGNIMNFLKGISPIYIIIGKEKDIDFLLDIEDNGNDVWFSPSKLERIMYNLLSNAFKYTYAGGYVKLSGKLVVSEGITFAEISVKDNGRGIPEKMINKIFDNYIQVKPSDHREGFGLGLSLTRSLVHMHHGEIMVKSEEGKGSEFIVRLNVSESAYSEQQRSPECITADEIKKYNKRTKDTINLIPEKISETNNGINREKIMIVEDNKEMNDYLTSIFNTDYEVMRAYNGAEAYEMISKKIPDIIICDVMMPKMNGFELASKIKEDICTSHIPIIMLTAKSDDADQTEGLLNGADAYITKPFNAHNLELLVKNIQKNRQQNIEHFKQSEALNINQITNNPRDEKFMKNLVDFIMENISDENLDVSRITDELHISRSLLHNKVKALSGSSITQFIRTIKMRESKKLLISGMNVSETSYAVGISDPNYFTKCFKKEFDITPTDFLRISKNEIG